MARFFRIWKQFGSAMSQPVQSGSLSRVLVEFGSMTDDDMRLGLYAQPATTWIHWGEKLSSLRQTLSGEALVQAERIIQCISYMD